MDQDTCSRYAIYWLAEGDLADRASAWLGWDNVTGARAPQDPEQASWTEEPRKYGFHATIKPPFRLAPGWDAAALVAAFDALCARLAPVTLPGLSLATLGEFLALRPDPAGDPAPLQALAAEVVRQLDPARAPLTPAEIARRRPESLSPRQRALLEDWGYPHVMEEFRFHMTLTGRLSGEERLRAIQRLVPWLGPLPAPLRLDRLCLLGQGPEGFRRLHVAPLSGTRFDPLSGGERPAEGPGRPVGGAGG